MMPKFCANCAADLLIRTVTTRGDGTRVGFCAVCDFPVELTPPQAQC